MDTFEQQFADAKRSKQEALDGIEKINAGGPLPQGMTREAAIKILNENIATFDAIIKKLGWRENAKGT